MDKLTRVVRGQTEVAEFTYGGLGERRSAEFSSGTTGFVYDGSRVICETDSAGNMQAYYVIGRGGTTSRLTSSTTRYYHGDGLASVKALTDNGSLITDDYCYDAWGNSLAHLGSTSQPYQYVGQLGYYTHYQDSNLDLLQLGARYYDPGVGRFTQVDPIRHGGNWYTYVMNAPTRRVDPRGLEPNWWDCGNELTECNTRAGTSALACTGRAAKRFSSCTDHCTWIAIFWPLGGLICEARCAAQERRDICACDRQLSTDRAKCTAECKQCMEDARDAGDTNAEPDDCTDKKALE